MKLIAIVAMSWPNAIIGQDGKLPWKLPEDLRRFKEATGKHPIIMGRKTHESIGRVLPDRMNIILTRSRDYKVPNAVVCNDLDKALYVLKYYEYHTAFIIGGAEIYKQALPICDEVLVTHVNAGHIQDGIRFEGDFSGLQPISCEWVYKDEKNQYDMRFERWVRI